MTDNEIIKALECCAVLYSCKGCPLKDFSTACVSINKRNAFDLINRQKAEIERLNSCVKSEDEIRAIMKDKMFHIVKEIVNEQIDSVIKLSRREFAEKLKKNLDISATGYSTEEVISQVEDEVDNLLKEMESESK